MRIRQHSSSGFCREQSQRTISRDDRPVSITSPGKPACGQLQLFFRLHQAGTQICGERGCHIPFQQGDIALFVTKLPGLLQTRGQLVLFAVKGTEIGCILIISPGTLHFGDDFLFHHIPIVFAGCDLFADKRILIERSEQRAQRLGHFDLIIVARLAIDLSP